MTFKNWQYQSRYEPIIQFKEKGDMNYQRRVQIISTLICLALILGVGINVVAASPARQEETDFNAVDAYVAEQMDNLNIPGLGLAIIQDGQIAHLQGLGEANSAGRAVTPQTPFNLASVTKSFTALAVMQLVEAGKIDLDAPVQRYLPWFELADKEASAEITVRHLLNQTTGISEKDGNRFWASQKTLEEEVRGLDYLQLAEPVGTTFQYSNINYGIAGLIVEKVSGQSYADYVTEHIFEPLDMRHSYGSRPAALANGLAESHYYMFGQVFQAEGPRPPVALSSGFLMASVEDMAHYAMAQLNNGQYAGNSVLSPQGMVELHAPAISTGEETAYAMGWHTGSPEGTPLIWHAGDDGRNSSVVVLMPDSASAVILLSNISGFERLLQINGVVRGVMKTLNGEPPASVSPAFQLRFLYWVTLLAPLVQILGIAFVWRKRTQMKTWVAALVIILNLAMVAFILILAQNVPTTLSSMLVWYPELASALIIVTTLGIGWSVVFTVMRSRMRRASVV
jgi:CubicO group peptidase (beta-lactamase class C family)